MSYLGDFTAGATLGNKFNTHTADGVPITLSGGTVKVYKQGNATESTAGVTFDEDYDGVTGLHQWIVDTSADGSFYATANNFDVILTAGTVDGLSVAGTKLATFSIGNRSTLAIKAKTDNLPSDPADASDIASSFTTVNGKLDTIDDFLDTEIAAIKAKTDLLPTDPADASDIAAAFVIMDAKLDVIDDFLDTEVAAIKVKTDFLPSFASGTQGGLHVLGVNNADVSYAGQTGPGMTYTGANGYDGIKVVGQGIGHGFNAVGGAGSNTVGIKGTSASANGFGMALVGTGARSGLSITPGSTGHGVTVTGGATSGSALFFSNTSGDLITGTATAGHGLNLTAGGSGKHGIQLTGGTAGDGLHLVGGAGGFSLWSIDGFGTTGNDELADAVLDRNMATGTDSGSTTVRTLRNSLRFLRNRWTLVGTTLTVYKEDDTTIAWTAVVSTDAAVDSVVGNNPAGP